MGHKACILHVDLAVLHGIYVGLRQALRLKPWTDTGSFKCLLCETMIDHFISLFQGECEKNVKYMVGFTSNDGEHLPGHCQLSCGTCTLLSPSGASAPPSTLCDAVDCMYAVTVPPSAGTLLEPVPGLTAGGSTQPRRVFCCIMYSFDILTACSYSGRKPA